MKKDLTCVWGRLKITDTIDWLFSRSRLTRATAPPISPKILLFSPSTSSWSKTMGSPWADTGPILSGRAPAESITRRLKPMCWPKRISNSRVDAADHPWGAKNKRCSMATKGKKKCFFIISPSFESIWLSVLYAMRYRSKLLPEGWLLPCIELWQFKHPR